MTYKKTTPPNTFSLSFSQKKHKCSSIYKQMKSLEFLKEKTSFFISTSCLNFSTLSQCATHCHYMVSQFWPLFGTPALDFALPWNLFWLIFWGKYSTGSSFKLSLLTIWFICHFVNTCVFLFLQNWFINLFFSLSHCPSHVNQASNDILLLDFSAEVDSNQNCIKGNSFVTSCAPDRRACPQTENPFSSTFGYFPTPDSDPFRDDPLSKSPTWSEPDYSQISLTATNRLNNATGNTCTTIINGGLNGDSEHLSQQINGLSSKNMILALSNGQWPLGGKITQGNTITMMDGNESGTVLSTKNPFFDSSLKTAPVPNGVTDHPQSSVSHSKDSVVISPPPQSSKAGRGRRSAKVKIHS